MSLVLEKTLLPATGIPDESATEEAKSNLSITVLFTTIEPTLSALRMAGTLANRLKACLTLIVPQIIPYPLPLTSPPVLLDFNERRFRVIAGECPVETAVQIYLCRDRYDLLARALKPHSVVVIGSRKRWWPTAEKRLCRRLRRVGHEVVLAED